MEKFSFILSSVLILSVFVNLNSAHPYKQFWEECKAAEKATDEEARAMRNPDQPKSRAMKCVIACIGEKSGKLVNNKLNGEAVMESMKHSPNYNEDMHRNFSEMVEECKDVNDADRCESASKIMDCMTDAAAKRGIKREYFMQGNRK
ncbi:General odorant-binding protein 56h [Pseudolycoriella hygida]|uniref:General odorant-binding protein 56h n=1 Tax=Pseudolycoriella hygida TaxID=35572 RepID=A0A9Q0MNJ6_9DIPT|nr:General odorant-binding protein 56h [Pseudolycoriella hygida]